MADQQTVQVGSIYQCGDYSILILQVGEKHHFAIYDGTPGWLNEPEAHNISCEGSSTAEMAIDQALTVLEDINAIDSDLRLTGFTS